MCLAKGAWALITVLATVSLAGCATSLDSKPDTASSSEQQTVGNGLTPTFGSEQKTVVKGFTPSFDAKEQPGHETGVGGDANAAQAANALASVATPGNYAYRIGPLDVLDVSVYQVPELTKTVQVASNGTIDIPLIGETPAAGKTTQELQRDLNSRLGAKYLQNPQTTVLVKEFNSSRVTISGAVKNPGVFPYKGETLLQYVAMAGGFGPEANSMVLILRQTQGQRSAAKFDVSAIQNGRLEDPRIQSGDIIVADTSVMKKGLNAILKVLPLATFAAI